MREYRIKAPAVLYKYLSADRISVVENGWIRFSPPHCFNDPFDCRGPAEIFVSNAQELPTYGGSGWIQLEQCSDDEVEVLNSPSVFHDGHEPFGSHLSLSKEIAAPSSPINGEPIELDLSFALSLPMNLKLNLGGSPRPIRQGYEDQPCFLIGTGPSGPKSVVLKGGYQAQSRLEKLGVLCLSERFDSILMWSHYSDSHRGLVIGLSTGSQFFDRLGEQFVTEDGPKVFATDHVPPLCKINYLHERVNSTNAPDLFFSRTHARARFSDAEEEPSDIKVSESSEFAQQAELFCKARDWEYEQEWRLFAALTDAPFPKSVHVREEPRFKVLGSDVSGLPVTLLQLPPTCIVDITLGMNMPLPDMLRVARILESRPDMAHIQLYLANGGIRRFSITRTPVTPQQLLAFDADELSDERARHDFREALENCPASTLGLLRNWLVAGRLSANFPLRQLEAAIGEALITKTVSNK